MECKLVLLVLTSKFMDLESEERRYSTAEPFHDMVSGVSEVGYLKLKDTRLKMMQHQLANVVGYSPNQDLYQINRHIWVVHILAKEYRLKVLVTFLILLIKTLQKGLIM